ncbi:MAG: hypothetical protein ACRDF4_05250, partial [Rhabdochlamydiaceae bacterium]
AYLTHEHYDNLPFYSDLQSLKEVHISMEVFQRPKSIQRGIGAQYASVLGNKLKAYDTFRIGTNQSLNIPSPNSGNPSYFIELTRADHNRSGSFFAFRTPLFLFLSEAKGEFILNHGYRIINGEKPPKYLIISSPTAFHDLSQETVRDIVMLCNSKGVTPVMIATWVDNESSLLMSNEFGRKYGRYLPSGFVVFPKVIRSYFDMGYR